MEKTKKIGYFKRLKMAIFELENYIEFLTEKLGRAIGFCFKTSIILALLMTISTISFIYLKYGSPGKYVDNIFPNFEYADQKMTIDESDNKTDEKKAIIAVMKRFDLTYKEILNDSIFSKNDLIDYINKNEARVIGTTFVVVFIESIIQTFVFWLMASILTFLVGWIVFKFSRIKMRFSKLYALSIYATTLSVVLTVIYTILNLCFNVYIDIFDYLSMLIAYIYITAVVYMIKSDLIKEHMELIRIVSAQNEIMQRAEREKEKEKEEQEDKERQGEKERQKDKERQEEKERQKEKEKTGEENKEVDDEPDGSEI